MYQKLRKKRRIESTRLYQQQQLLWVVMPSWPNNNNDNNNNTTTTTTTQNNKDLFLAPVNGCTDTHRHPANYCRIFFCEIEGYTGTYKMQVCSCPRFIYRYSSEKMSVKCACSLVLFDFPNDNIYPISSSFILCSFHQQLLYHVISYFIFSPFLFPFS